MRIVLALLALMFLAWVDPVAARELKISHQWPAEADARDRAARIFVKEVLARAPDVSFQIYPQLSLKMKAEEQFGALQSGAADLSVYPLPYAVKQVPEFSLAVLPCLYPSLDIVRGLKGSQIADRLGYLDIHDGLLVGANETKHLRDDEVVFLVTGSQDDRCPVEDLGLVRFGDAHHVADDL